MVIKMTEDEIKKEEKEVKTEMWSMDDLVALTDEVQEGEIEFKEKLVKFQYCELVEKEEPKFRPLSVSYTHLTLPTIYSV